MKTLIRNEDGISIYLFDDAEVLVFAETEIVVGDPVKFIIGDRNSGNTTLCEGISAPDDWEPWRYKFSDEKWIAI